jgi:hypothetical protein
MKQLVRIFSRLKPSGNCTCHVLKHVNTLYFAPLEAFINEPIPLAALCKAWVCSRWLTGFVGSNSDGECYVLSARSLCCEPEESCRM